MNITALENTQHLFSFNDRRAYLLGVMFSIKNSDLNTIDAFIQRVPEVSKDYNSVMTFNKYIASHRILLSNFYFRKLAVAAALHYELNSHTQLSYVVKDLSNGTSMNSGDKLPTQTRTFVTNVQIPDKFIARNYLEILRQNYPSKGNAKIISTSSASVLPPKKQFISLLNLLDEFQEYYTFHPYVYASGVGKNLPTK